MLTLCKHCLPEDYSVPATTPGIGDLLGIKDVDVASCSWNNELVGEAGVSQGITLLGLKGYLGCVLKGRGTWRSKGSKAASGK